MGIFLYTLVEKMWSSLKNMKILVRTYFNTKTKPHKFCKTCGSNILADFERIKLGETDDPARDILAFNVGLSPRLKARCLFS